MGRGLPHEVTGDQVVLPVVEEDGVLLRAGLPSVGASGLKKTAPFRGEVPPFLWGSSCFSPLTRDQLGNRREQELCIGVQGATEKVFSVGHLHNLSHVHHCNTVADMFYDTKIVGDKQVGETELVPQIHQQVQNLRLDGDIEGGDGLIGDNQLRDEGRPPWQSRFSGAARR